LLRGNAADASAFTRLLGRSPRPVEQFMDAAQREPVRLQAIVATWFPILRCTIALLWIWTGAVSLGLYPKDDSLALLARVGLHGGVATLALYGAAVLDLVLGILTVAAPAPWRGILWASQLLLIAAYTVLISVFLPEFWLHPYGPLSKNLPLMAAIALLWALEPSRRKAGSR
jgi:hypothetical protein